MREVTIMRSCVRQKDSMTVASGVITVYLSLILLVILSLVFTIIEGARVNTGKVYAERALSSAMDSVWAEYYEPLWKEYHIFGYGAGEGSDREKAGKIEKKLAQYMTYTLQPDIGMDGGSLSKTIDLYDINLTSLAVTDQTGLIEYQGELMRKEAVEYMKYHELADGFTLLLEKLSLLETPRKVSVVYNKKLAAEEELAKADKSILRLMELSDGLKTSKTGIKLDENGQLLTSDYFVKMLCQTPVTMESAGINHQTVFEAVKNRYVDPIDTISQVQSGLDQLILVKQWLNQIQEQIDVVYSLINSVEARLQSLRGSDQLEEEDKERESLYNEMRSLQDQLSRLHNQSRELNDRKSQLFTSTESRLSRMKNILQELEPILEEAEHEAKQVVTYATASTHLIDDFEKSLYEEEKSLGEEIFEGLKERLTQMRRYSSSEGKESLYPMCDTLEINQSIIKESQVVINETLNYLRSEDYSMAIAASDQALEKLEGYKINSLTIDYSTLVLDQTKQKNPVKELSKLIQSGIAGLVLEPDSISQKELTAKQLPSVEASIASERIDFTSMIKDFFEDAMKGGEENKLDSLLYSFQDNTKLLMGMEEGIDWIAEQLLYQEYLKGHFETYPVGDHELSGRKPSILDYEQEYLLVGKTMDRENLSSVISRVVFLRMILDFVTILGDKARCDEAKLAAAAIVGFTGLPMLISLTQAMILMVWSFAEALVDTSALLLGKEVPILKQKIILQLPDLFLLNRSYLQTKAQAISTTKQLSFSYQDYLRMFLLIKNKKDLTCRSMDLIQENLNLRYEEKLKLRDCLFGFEAAAEYTIDTKFIAIPFIRSYLKREVIGYRFTSRAGYSY